MKKKFKVGIIGNGGRSTTYARDFALFDEIQVVAIADPCTENSDRMLQVSHLDTSALRRYSDWRELHEKETDLDGVVISTPNYLHHEPAVAFIRRNIPIALEKPLTTSMGDSEYILDAVREHNARLIVGFVLRSTPFYRTIYDLISGGRIGRLVTVQADELASYGVSSILSRGLWRRFSRTSGGTMMEKSSHDMDILNWMTNARPVSVNSYGGRLVFRPNPMLPERCADCKLKDSCNYYSNPRFDPKAGDAILHKFLREGSGECIYNVDKDVFDNQGVSVLYSNGAVANFMLSLNCSGERSGRNFHAVGVRGRIWGNFSDPEIRLYDNLANRVEVIKLPKISSPHKGVDSHPYELLKMMKDASYRPEQDAYAGYLSNALCIAADLSAGEARQIHFRYDANGYVTFA
ncbi:MAG: putative oxidoreductase YteT precursor [Lentisphaerae bacterium ADurb.Bin242]|nr:MAG: putative oxidoreductase YteT precursor [Lentisphaerae bacterium ADurb.Bin242]